jgi:hypothetical protein
MANLPENAREIILKSARNVRRYSEKTSGIILKNRANISENYLKIAGKRLGIIPKRFQNPCQNIPKTFAWTFGSISEKVGISSGFI